MTGKEFDFGGYEMYGPHGLLGPQEMAHVFKQLAAGPVVGTSDIVVGGKKIILPDGMSGMQVIVAILNWVIQQEQYTDFTRTFSYRPYDGANAANAVMQTLYGFVIGTQTHTEFGPINPQIIEIDVGPDETAQIPWGKVLLPSLDALVSLEATRHPEYGMVFRMRVHAQHKHADEVRVLFEAVEDHLRHNSIYRGKAITATGSTEPTYMDLSAVEVERIRYPDRIQNLLDVNVLGPMRMTAAYDEINIPTGVCTLAAGGFGTGKTLAGQLAGLVAIQSNWTALYASSGAHIIELLQLAKLYAPCFIFAEDIDVFGASDVANLQAMLEAFDGVQAKGHKIVVLLTANNPQNMAAAMLRCGRTDVLINMNEQDAGSVERLIQAKIGPNQLAADIDYATIARATKDFSPAFIGQVAELAARAALFEHQGATSFKLTNDNLLEAAHQVGILHKVMVEAMSRTTQPLPETAYMEAIAAAVTSRMTQQIRISPDGQLMLEAAEDET